jgi:hypothetical protein
MRQVSPDDLRSELSARLKRLKEPAQRATFLDIRRRDLAVEIIAGAVVSFLEERHYRVVSPSMINGTVAATGHGTTPTAGRWGIDEPEPGE